MHVHDIRSYFVDATCRTAGVRPRIEAGDLLEQPFIEPAHADAVKKYPVALFLVGIVIRGNADDVRLEVRSGDG